MAATITPRINYDLSTLQSLCLHLLLHRSAGGAERSPVPLPAPQIGLGMSAPDGERLQVAGPRVRLGGEKSFGG